MKLITALSLAALTFPLAGTVIAGEISLESAPPVVVRTTPVTGSIDVDSATPEIRVTFSKPMCDGSWSWSTWGEENYPETTGNPRYLSDGRTCVLPVKLQPGKLYALWLNSENFKNFKDTNNTPAVPYLLTFATARAAAGPAGQAHPLNDNQRRVLEWTDRQFRKFFDQRTFVGWSDKERADLETRLIDTLKGPLTQEYYQAINTLAVLGSTNALPALRTIAFDRRDQDCRDRWMAIRTLGLLGDQTAVPELIHLVYHGNVNTHWWAQISLVRLTGRNFGSDWSAWGKWWNESGRQPPFQPEIIRWWSGQSEPEKLAESLADSDRQFLEKLP
jgi:hypothetical protein